MGTIVANFFPSSEVRVGYSPERGRRVGVFSRAAGSSGGTPESGIWKRTMTEPALPRGVAATKTVVIIYIFFWMEHSRECRCCPEMQQSNLKPISYNTKDDSGFSAAGTVFFQHVCTSGRGLFVTEDVAKGRPWNGWEMDGQDSWRWLVSCRNMCVFLVLNADKQ